MSNEFEIMAQRHVCPIFLKDELGGFEFSSTTTFIKRQNKYFCVFAGHAVPRGVTTLENIGVLKTDGTFVSLNDISVNYFIDRDNDLVICETLAPFEQKNYFDLDTESTSTVFKEDGMGWIGFPKKKAKAKYHRTKASPEHVKADIDSFEDGRLKWTNANYLLLGVDQIRKEGHVVSAFFDDKNVTYDKDGFKEQAYSLKGMSGGALFHAPSSFTSNPQYLSDYFKFVGIGLEHHTSEKTIKGASSELVKELIDVQLAQT
ncbi:hypothetical protein CMT41_08585 [Colwellia sp. MT41]|uniref:hypothetical protein n=1 Tax=Colwellia sp. MT41 TaxID=58049 RepID=UPI000717A582|nr:hypothetical protein [Colwellia sp. MT41]ALO34763.1 hypothetical protein CMT41_08585 [Colwellia sp. MT41]